jgi:hypothetical protein
VLLKSYIPLKKKNVIPFESNIYHSIIILVSHYKVKLSCYHHAGNKGERRYSSYSFFTLGLEHDQCHSLAALYPQAKDPHPPGSHCIGGCMGMKRLKEKSFASARDQTLVTQLSSL